MVDWPCARPNCENSIPADFDYRGAEANISFTLWRAEGAPGFGHVEAKLCGRCANDLYDFWFAKDRELKLS